jgi:diketogulonate reductase-like aldo/keto reductase
VVYRSRETAALVYADLFPDNAHLTHKLSQTVYNAIKVGYRLLDGAGDYGNEREAGEGVRRALDEGIVKRDELCE